MGFLGICLQGQNLEGFQVQSSTTNVDAHLRLFKGIPSMEDVTLLAQSSLVLSTMCSVSTNRTAA